MMCEQRVDEQRQINYRSFIVHGVLPPASSAQKRERYRKKKRKRCTLASTVTGAAPKSCKYIKSARVRRLRGLLGNRHRHVLHLSISMTLSSSSHYVYRVFQKLYLRSHRSSARSLALSSILKPFLNLNDHDLII